MKRYVSYDKSLSAKQSFFVASLFHSVSSKNIGHVISCIDLKNGQAAMKEKHDVIRARCQVSARRLCKNNERETTREEGLEKERRIIFEHPKRFRGLTLQLAMFRSELWDRISFTRYFSRRPPSVRTLSFSSRLALTILHLSFSL